MMLYALGATKPRKPSVSRIFLTRNPCCEQRCSIAVKYHNPRQATTVFPGQFFSPILFYYLTSTKEMFFVHSKYKSLNINYIAKRKQSELEEDFSKEIRGCFTEGGCRGRFYGLP
jgi:hypothetical protein